MKKRQIYIIIAAALLLCFGRAALSGEPPGTALSRPNVSGGFDFYDSGGNKIGSSSRDSRDDFIYYDESGDFAGKLVFDAKRGDYTFYDADNIRRGSLVKDRYGGYRYRKIESEQETSSQLGIRKDYDYADPYGGGIETLPIGVIKGENVETQGPALSTSADTAGLETSSEMNKTELKAPKKTGLTSVPGKRSGLSTS